MANKLYNQKSVAQNSVSVGDTRSGSYVYKGFSSNETTRGFKLYDADLVKQDIINHFYIRKGEKLENPGFGSVIWEMLFEQFTEEVKEIIAKNVEEIINYDPRIVVNQVVVDSTDQGMRVEAEIRYIQFNATERMTFNFDRSTQTII